MVLEHIFPDNWLEKKARYAFLLGAFYSVIGILLSKLLFPADPALVAVAFTALLLLPSLSKLLSREEKKEKKERIFSFNELYRDNKELIRVYLFLVLGIFLVYSLAAMILPSFQVNELFREQLEMRGAGGNAIFTQGLFWQILLNNWWVLLACFFISLLTGDGAIFLITWNASLWGTIFGVTARDAALYANTSPYLYFLIVLAIVLPHAFLEILSYILAAIAGGIISKDVILEKFESKKFKEVFLYNSLLFLVAIGVLIIGAFVETYVLSNVDIYREIILQSYYAFR